MAMPSPQASLRILALVAAAAAMHVVAPACAGSVRPGPPAAAAGVTAFELTTAPDPDATAWICQVVGAAHVAGSVRITRDHDTLRMHAHHVLTGADLDVFDLPDGTRRIERQGEVVAGIRATAFDAAGRPTAFAREGFVALQADPAWILWQLVARDEAIRAAIAPPSPPVALTGPCDSACEAKWPVPAGCTSPSTSYACCVVIARNQHCHAVCACEGLGTPAQVSACRAAADAALQDALDACAGSPD